MPILTKDFLDSEFPEPDGKFTNPEPVPAEAAEPEADMSRDVVGPMGSAINSEEETIVFYKDLLDMFPDFAPVLKDIIAEEEKHIGQLEVLRNSSSSEMTKNIEKGVEEAEHQLETGSSEEPDDLGEAEVEVGEIAIEVPEETADETTSKGEIPTEGDFKEYSDKVDIEAAEAEIETDDEKSRYIDDILNEDASKKKWIYKGPIYNDNGMVVRDGYEWIHADDKQTAVKELIKRLKKAYKSSHIHIEPQFVKAEGEESLITEAYNPEVKPGDKIRIIDMSGEPQYAGKTGEVEYIDDMGQIHGTWGGCALIPEEDTYELIVDECLKESGATSGKTFTFKYTDLNTIDPITEKPIRAAYDYVCSLDDVVEDFYVYDLLSDTTQKEADQIVAILGITEDEYYDMDTKELHKLLAEHFDEVYNVISDMLLRFYREDAEETSISEVLDDGEDISDEDDDWDDDWDD